MHGSCMTAESMAPPRRDQTRPVDAARRQWHWVESYIRGELTWNRLYRATSYARSALWIVPFFSILLVLLLAPLLRWLDTWLGWRLSGLGVAGATALYQTIISLTLAFLVFTFGSLLVAVQIAGGQLTPRIIATTLLRDNVVRYSVGLFVFALIFSVMALDRLEGRVHEIVALVTATLGIASIATFLFLIDYSARLLRPVSIVSRVGDEGLGVIKQVYPTPAGAVDEGGRSGAAVPDGPRRVLAHEGRSEIVLALDLPTLVREAEWTGGVIEFVPRVGDFVASDEPLFVLLGGATRIPDRTLRSAVAFGPERTLEQDPLFAFRILVDIALKALSPAINDPTTGVLALDQVQRLLRAVGRRHLRGEVIADASGQARVLLTRPDWEDFVTVSCHEIRICGAGNVQIARRLRAMLESLIATLPAHRHPALEEERRRLDLTIATRYPIPEDLALASQPDLQGLGGSPGGRPSAMRARDAR
jgi:uncharacterized membrane protein